MLVIYVKKAPSIHKNVSIGFHWAGTVYDLTLKSSYMSPSFLVGIPFLCYVWLDTKLN